MALLDRSNTFKVGNVYFRVYKTKRETTSSDFLKEITYMQLPRFDLERKNLCFRSTITGIVS